MSGAAVVTAEGSAGVPQEAYIPERDYSERRVALFFFLFGLLISPAILPLHDDASRLKVFTASLVNFACRR